jgi:hypothetical protein
MFLIRCGGTLADPWASSLPETFSLAANEALYWKAIQHGMATGAARFDMGRSQPDSGTCFFKKKWGARVVPLVYQYVLGTRSSPPSLAEQKRTFALASLIWRRLPLAATAILGERVKRLFPEVM